MATNISTIVFDAPIYKVWDALTNPEKVKRWQFGSDLITTWEIGSDITFITEWEGQIFKQWGKVQAFNQDELITYSLFAPRPGLDDKSENYFIMTYRLITEDNRTKLEIIQQDNRPGAVQEAPQGEENPILQSLKSVVEAS